MTVIVVTPPATTPVSLADAKKHLRIDYVDDDDLIENLISAATATFDGPDSTLGRSLLKQTLQLKLDAFPCAVNNFDVWDRQRWRDEVQPYYRDSWRSYFVRQQIPLPYPPYLGGLAITYLDTTGSQQSLDPSVYRIIGGGSGLSKLALQYNQSWPGVQFIEESVSIQFDAGYGQDETDVPAPIRQAILLVVGHLYENRQSVVVDQSRVQAIELPQGVEALVAPYRVLI